MDKHTPQQRSFNMSQVKSRDTKLEIKFRDLMTQSGLSGYELNGNVFGKPDIVFPRNKTVIFLDGCFWHKCPEHFVMPTTRIDFWDKKIGGNVKRDKIVDRGLKKSGWYVLRFWEHELRSDLDKCVGRIKKFLS
ncbi:MAG: very short patch repair endonuclease [Candidatus Woykebacteria bacterium]